MQKQDKPAGLVRAVAGIDAATTARHHIGGAGVFLRRAVVRRAGAVNDGNRYWRRLLSLARWAFPDVWTAFAGSELTALAVLEGTSQTPLPVPPRSRPPPGDGRTSGTDTWTWTRWPSTSPNT